MKKILYFVYHSVIDFIAKFTKVKIRRNTVLIIRLDAIGDFVLWLDAAKEFKKLYPPDEYKTVLVGNQIWTSLAEKTSYFNEVWALDKRSFSRNPIYRYRFLKRVRQAGFETVINTVFSRDFYWSDAIVRASNALNRIGQKGDSSNIESRWQKRIADNSYTHLVTLDNDAKMELLRNAGFMRRMGLVQFKSSIPILNFPPRKPDAFNLKDYYVIFPGASWEGKKWPAHNFAEIARRLHQTTGWTCVICGAKEDGNLYRCFLNGMNVPTEDWVGKTSLEELAAILDDARLVISNDTSAVHIAAAEATHTICILGGGHYGRFMPYIVECEPRTPIPVSVTHKMDCFECNWHCIYELTKGAAVPCIANISVDDVWNAIPEAIIHSNSIRARG